MTIKLSTILAAGLILAAPAAFAQSAGTSGTGTSNGVEGTPGQASASQPGNAASDPASTGTQGGALGVRGGTDVPAAGTGAAAGAGR